MARFKHTQLCFGTTRSLYFMVILLSFIKLMLVLIPGKQPLMIIAMINVSVTK